MKEIEYKLAVIDKLLEDFANNCDFTYLEQNQLNNIDANYLDKLTNSPGIYFFELKSENDSDFDHWLENFKQDWNNSSIKNSPQIIKKRINNVNHSEWIPLYIGKSKTLKKRVTEHFNLKPTSSTYAMKLNARQSLQNSIVRIGYITIETKHYDLVMSKIESVLRERHQPIIGKQ